jgi:hypothetical protein
VAEIQTIGEVPIEKSIGASGFGISRVLRTRLPEHQKSRNRERRSGPSILRRTRGGDQSIREVSRKESSPSAFRESGNRESRGQEVLAIRNREVRNSDKEGKAPSWGPAVSIAENRDSRDRQSREQMHFGI